MVLEWRVRASDDTAVRPAFGAGDWLGPGSPIGVAGPITLTLGTRDLAPSGACLTLTLTATAPTSSARAGGLTDVRVGVRFDPSARTDEPPAGLRATALQHTEFGLPITAGASFDRWYDLPFRPNIAWPVWLTADDGRCVLLAPLDSFHDQVIAYPRDGAPSGLTWGWHGDLDEIPAGFTSTLGIFGGHSPRALLHQWAALVPRAARLPVDHDTLGRSVSYWTDNGAAYWYRTEPPRSVTETVVDAVASVEAAGVPIGAVQLDSWFYPHQVLRPFDTDEWVVPPTGLVEWAPRTDILPDGFGPLTAALAGHPLATHCRHLSSASPYVEQFDCWLDGEYAHPVGADYYEALLDQAREWGVETFEHDWLVECFTGVRGLRAAPGRADAWQRGIDAAAAARAMTLQWCMATPADMALAAALPRVTSVRTSGDHGYLVGPGFLWAWFCLVNALARELGLAPYKDVFLSGDEHAEVEALLSALSTGPVGLGDAIGTTDAAVARRCCRADGTIVRPDVPIAAVDSCFARHPVSLPQPLVAECHTDHAAGRWTQIFCAHTYRKPEPVAGSVELGDLGDGTGWPGHDIVALDLRAGTVTRPTAPWSFTLEPQQWTHHLLAPVLAGGITVFGDRSLHAPVGRARVEQIEATATTVTVTVVAGADEAVTIDGWAARRVEIGGGRSDQEQSADGTVRWTASVVGPATIDVALR